MAHKELTAKRELFCKFYAEIGSETFGNGTKAAIKAGFAPKRAVNTASQLLKLPHIQTCIGEYEKKIASVFDLDKPAFERKVMEYLNAVSPASANAPKYLDIFAKLKGFYEATQTNITIFNQMSPNEIKEKLERIKGEIRRAIPAPRNIEWQRTDEQSTEFTQSD